MITHKEIDEKMSDLIEDRKSLLRDAEDYTEEVINDEDLDQLINLAIGHAVDQNAKIFDNIDEFTIDKLLILDSYFDLSCLKNQILKVLHDDAEEQHWIRKYYIFENQIAEVVENKLNNATKERLNNKGFKKIKIKLSSDEYYLLPPNYMDEYVYIWVSNKLQEESKRDVKLTNFISFMIVVPNLLGIFLYLFSSIQLLPNPNLFKSLALVLLLISFISLIYGIYKRPDMKLIKFQLLKLLAVEKREREQK